MDIVYDVEVERGHDEVEGGWENPEGMGFSAAATYCYKDDQYRLWLGSKAILPLISYLYGNRAITFNGIKFDSRVLFGNDRIVDKEGRVGWALPKYGKFGFKEEGIPKSLMVENYDILQEYIKARFDLKTAEEAEAKLRDKDIHDGTFTLGGIALGTLGLRKTGTGTDAPVLYREKKYGELLSYVLNDVRLTRKLNDFIQKNHFVIDSAGRKISL